MSEAARLTVFRSRLRADAGTEYEATADEMEALARSMPGFVSFKTYAADDGERVSIAVFDSGDSHDAWRTHPRHRVAQQAGRDQFYDAYDIDVCEVLRSSSFRRSDTAT